MDEKNAYYEAYVKTDEFQLVIRYLTRIDLIGDHYRALCKNWYNGKLDARSLLLFYSFSDEFFFFAEENIKEHLSKDDYELLKSHFQEFSNGKPPKKGIRQAREIFRLLQRFGWKSGLLKLKGSRPKGKFGKIYAELGLPRQPGANQ